MFKRMIAMVAAAAAVGGGTAYAQEVSRFEAGGQISPLYLQEFATVLPRRRELAVGGRFTVNLTRFIAADSELDFYPTDRFFDDRRKIQGLVGVKAGVRRNRIGVFGKVRPGFVRISEPALCLIPEGCPFDLRRYVDRTWFALDMGGVVEAYPSSRFLLRLDVGDTFVRYVAYNDGQGRPVYFKSHNLQLGAGAAVRF